MPYVSLKEDHLDQGAALLAHRPEILAAWAKLDEALMGAGSTLPVSLKENVRVALSQRVGCRYCDSLGSVGDEAPDARESLALAFVQKVLDDPKAVDQSTFDVLREEFTEEQIVELSAWICFKLATNTLGAITGLEPAGEEQQAGYRAWLDAQELAAAG